MYRRAVNGRTVYLVDTPGFDDHRRSDAQILEEISFWLVQAAAHGFRVAGLIYLHRITDNRIAGSGQRSLNIFQKICGSQNFHLCLLITTHWDLVLHDQNLRLQALRRQAEITTAPGWWGEVSRQGGRHGAMIDSQSAKNLLEDLVQQNHSSTLLLQEQLLVPDSRLADTDAGKVVVERWREVFLGLQQDLESVRAEIVEAQSQHLDEALQELCDLERDIKEQAEAHTRHLMGLQESPQLIVEATLQRMNEERDQMMKTIELECQGNNDFNQIRALCEQVDAQIKKQLEMQHHFQATQRHAAHSAPRYPNRMRNQSQMYAKPVRTQVPVARPAPQYSDKKKIQSQEFPDTIRATPKDIAQPVSKCSDHKMIQSNQYFMIPQAPPPYTPQATYEQNTSSLHAGSSSKSSNTASRVGATAGVASALMAAATLASCNVM